MISPRRRPEPGWEGRGDDVPASIIGVPHRVRAVAGWCPVTEGQDPPSTPPRTDGKGRR